MFVHVGVHKTGSTYLQKKVFPFLDCEFFGPGTPVCNDLLDVVCGRGSKQIFRDRWDVDFGRPVLISDESLFGRMSQGYSDFESNALRLKEVLPDAHIVITIRRQDAWIESSYKNFIRHGWSFSFASFCGKDCSAVDRSQPHITVCTPDWLRYIRRYVELFGADNVTVLCQEELRESPEEFVGKLTAVMQIKSCSVPLLSSSRSNEGLSRRSCVLARILNWFTYRKGSFGVLPRKPFKDFVSRFKNDRGIKRWLYFASYYCDSHLLLKYFDRKFPDKCSILSEELRSEINRIHCWANRELCKYGVDFERYRSS